MQEAEIPAHRRPLREDDRADLVGDGSEGVARRDDVARAHPDVGARERILVDVAVLVSHQSPSSGFTFRTAARYVVRGRVFSSASSE